MTLIKLAPVPLDPCQPGFELLLAQRRSCRDYTSAALSLEDVTHLLWSAQGITDPAGLRTAPSAGALYPLEIYAAAARVDGLPAGLYHYAPTRHALAQKRAGDVCPRLADAALGQESVRSAPAVLVLTGVEARTRRKYGTRARRYVYLEAGHAAQNAFLLAVARGLGSVVVGAFDDDALAGALDLPAGESPLYLMPVGHPV